jgi:hypothetical protein
MNNWESKILWDTYEEQIVICLQEDEIECMVIPAWVDDKNEDRVYVTPKIKAVSYKQDKKFLTIDFIKEVKHYSSIVKRLNSVLRAISKKKEN